MNKIIELAAGDRILISRTDKLGDLILALPFVESMKKRYPECRIDVMASLYASPILENNPSIDRIVRVQNDMLVRDALYKKDLLHRLKLSKYHSRQWNFRGSRVRPRWPSAWRSRRSIRRRG